MEITTQSTEEKMADTRSMPVRTDTVGMFLDGYDFIVNNPPGFAVALALEELKEESRR